MAGVRLDRATESELRALGIGVVLALCYIAFVLMPLMFIAMAICLLGAR